MSHRDGELTPDSLDRSDATGQGDEARVQRRGLLRHGALIMGAAGVATAVASAPRPAAAADDDSVVLGASNTASSTTSIAISAAAGSNQPTLALSNSNGPSLSLQALAADFPGAMELGEIANTALGPIIGVDSELGLTTTFLATGIDLADLPTPYPLPTPVRLLDTRTAAGRAKVIRTPTGAWDSAHRLKAGAWIDVETAVVSGEFETPGAWLNVTAASPVASGYLSVYPPGTYPGTSTLNFAKGVTLANGAFVGTGIVAGRYAVRVRTSAVTHVVLDLTGLVIKGAAPEPDALSGASARTKRSSTAVLTRRLRSSLAEKMRNSLTR